MARRVVWKYPIPLTGELATFQIPEGARFLHCAEQRDAVCLWFEVPAGESRTQQRSFRIFGTGDPSIDSHLTYVGTAQFVGALMGGRLVLHVYEVSYE